MPKFAPPPRTRLRERLLNDRLARVSDDISLLSSALQEAETRGLSPAEISSLEVDLSNRMRFQQDATNELTFIRAQNTAETEYEEQEALSPSKNRDGFYRTDNTRTAAILGTLQRERRQNALFTREAISRAKSIDAKGRGQQEYYNEFTKRFHGVGIKGYAAAASVSDPCIDYRYYQSVRRQVMFARGLNSGWRSPHKRRSPC